MPEIVSKSAPPVEAATSTPETMPAIQEALAAIRLDSQNRPEQYLEDTVVPHGGE